MKLHAYVNKSSSHWVGYLERPRILIRYIILFLETAIETCLRLGCMIRRRIDLFNTRWIKGPPSHLLVVHRRINPQYVQHQSIR
jgi:hypothetical protein